MDLKTIQAALDALLAGDSEACAEVLKNMIAQAAAGAAAAPAAEGSVTTEAAEVPAEDEETLAAKALSRSIMTLSSTTTAGAAEAWVKKLATERAAIDADRAALEHSERVSLVTELVTLRAETPGTAWERDASGNVPEGDARKPCKRLLSESLPELRTRVAALRPAQPAAGSGSGNLRSAVTTDESGLSVYELSKANEIKDPEKRKAFVMRRLSRRPSAA